MKELWLKILPILRDKEAFAQLFVRACVGIMFMGGSLKRKLFDLDRFTSYFEYLEIPAASIQAPMVALLEVLCGLLLIIGLGTRFAAATLCGIMVVAIATAGVKDKGVDKFFDDSFTDGVLNFIYLPEFLIFCICLWFVFAGPGRLSVDHGIARQHGQAE